MDDYHVQIWKGDLYFVHIVKVRHNLLPTILEANING
jgi:hypothetical protein